MMAYGEFVILALVSLPPILLCILIRSWAKDADRRHGIVGKSRGFEVKPITGQQARADTKKDDHHG